MFRLREEENHGICQEIHDQIWRNLQAIPDPTTTSAIVIAIMAITADSFVLYNG